MTETRAWAVFNRNGHIMSDTIRRRRKDSILAYSEGWSIPWRRMKRKYGVKCVPVVIKEVADGDNVSLPADRLTPESVRAWVRKRKRPFIESPDEFILAFLDHARGM